MKSHDVDIDDAWKEYGLTAKTNKDVDVDFETLETKKRTNFKDIDVNIVSLLDELKMLIPSEYSVYGISPAKLKWAEIHYYVQEWPPKNTLKEWQVLWLEKPFMVDWLTFNKLVTVLRSCFPVLSSYPLVDPFKNDKTIFRSNPSISYLSSFDNDDCTIDSL